VKIVYIPFVRDNETFNIKVAINDLGGQEEVQALRNMAV
jgi:hypothetical protein